MGPTPVIFSNSVLSAVLMFILADCSGVEEGGGVWSGVDVIVGVSILAGGGIGMVVVATEGVKEGVLTGD